MTKAPWTVDKEKLLSTTDEDIERHIVEDGGFEVTEEWLEKATIVYPGKLTDDIISTAMLDKERFYLSDGNGLFLALPTNKTVPHWKFEKMANRKRTRKDIGAYPEISINQARQIANKENESLEPKFNREFGTAHKHYTFKVTTDLYERLEKFSAGKNKSRFFEELILAYLDEVEGWHES